MIQALVTFVIYVVVLGLVVWVLLYLIQSLPMPHPFGQVARVVVIAVACLILILLLLQLLPGGGPIRLGGSLLQGDFGAQWSRQEGWPG